MVGLAWCDVGPWIPLPWGETWRIFSYPCRGGEEPLSAVGERGGTEVFDCKQSRSLDCLVWNVNKGLSGSLRLSSITPHNKMKNKIAPCVNNNGPNKKSLHQTKEKVTLARLANFSGKKLTGTPKESGLQAERKQSVLTD